MMPDITRLNGLQHFSQMILGLAFLCFLSVAHAESGSITLDHSQPRQSLAGHLQWLADPTGGLSIDDVSRPSSQLAFQPLKGFLSLGYTDQASWITFRYTVKASSQEKRYLLLAPYILNTVDIYIRPLSDAVRNQSPSWQAFHKGDHRAAEEVPYLTSEMIIPLPQNHVGEYQVFIRTKTTSSHHLRGWIANDKGVINSSAVTLVWVSAFIACALILGIIALLQSVRLNSAIQFWYGMYLFSEGISQISAQGILPVIMPGYAHYISDWLTSGSSVMAYISMSVIIMLVLKTRKEHIWLHKSLLLVIGIGIPTLMLAGTSYYNDLVPWIARSGLIIMPVTTYLYYKKLDWGNPAQRLFFLFFASCTLAALVNLLRLLGVIPINTFTNTFIMINTIFHMILLNTALSEKLLQAEKLARTAAKTSETRAVTLANEMTQELRKSKQQLEQSLKKEQATLQEQSRFIDMISHEYRTPLAIIKTNLDILELKAKPEWHSTDNLNAMTNATRRLQEIFNTGLSKGLNKDQWRYNITPVMKTLNARQTTDCILSDASVLWSNAVISIDHQLSSSAMIKADAALLKTVLFNLIDNGLKYSPPDSTIHCSTEQDDQTIVFRISNPVPHPEQIDLKALKDKYYRGGNSAGTTGLGMGLYLIGQIIEQHRGHLNIQLSEKIATSGVAEFTVSVTLPLSLSEVHIDATCS